MAAYYNEYDQFAAQWLRNLIAAGHIAPGDVDERSIVDVKADDLRGYSQCHFFAGIGGWSLALRMAGWPDDRPVWTGSCPCQPFSAAGKGLGTKDERHLWPVWCNLIRECRPRIVFGEQVEAAIRHGWLDLVQTDLEGIGYAVGAVGLPAACVGAPHQRARLWFVADSNGGLAGDRDIQRGGEHGQQPQDSRAAVRVADCDTAGRSLERFGGLLDGERQAQRHDPDGRGPNGRVAVPYEGERGRIADGKGRERDRAETGWLEGDSLTIACGEVGHLGDADDEGSQRRGVSGADQGRLGAGERSPWEASTLEWLPCRDGKVRPTRPIVQCVAYGIPSGVVPVGANEQTQEGVIHGQASDSSAPEAMSAVRNENGAQAIRGTAGGSNGLQQAKVLQSAVHGTLAGGQSQGAKRQGRPAAVSKGDENGLRAVRSDRAAACSPPGQESAEQQPCQPPDVVRFLSSAGAFAALRSDDRTTQALRSLRESCDEARLVLDAPDAIEEIWRSLGVEGQARLLLGLDAHGLIVAPMSPLASRVPARVGRLRAYGNAIVPQVAAEVIAAYIECRP